MELPKGADWASVLELASEQGVQGICLEAIEQLPVGTIPQQTLLQWIGLSEVQRQQYEQTWRVACKLDKLWAAEGIQATILKGRSIAQYYPVPFHRYSCDLDMFISEEWGRACELVEGQGQGFVASSAWACLHLFGNPYTKISERERIIIE